MDSGPILMVLKNSQWRLDSLRRFYLFELPSFPQTSTVLDVLRTIESEASAPSLKFSAQSGDKYDMII